MAKRILVCEDDLLNSRLLCAVLQSKDYAPRAVMDGAEVLTTTREFRPDLITMDINLPNVSGLELIAQLRADPELERAPILALTAYAEEHVQNQVLTAGASAFLSKPFSVVSFLAAVEQLLRDSAGCETGSLSKPDPP